jgi:hypothetical protein
MTLAVSLLLGGSAPLGVVASAATDPFSLLSLIG